MVKNIKKIRISENDNKLINKEKNKESRVFLVNIDVFSGKLNLLIT